MHRLCIASQSRSNARELRHGSSVRRARSPSSPAAASASVWPSRRASPPRGSTSCWRRDRPKRLQKAADDIAGRFGVKALAVACDVATPAGTDKLVAETLAAFSGTDILINNAGTGSNETILDAPDEKWNDYWQLHVMAAVRLARVWRRR